MTELMLLGTEGGLPVEYGLLGRNRGYLIHGFLLLLLRYGTPDWAKGERKDCVCFKGLWDFNEDIKSLLLCLYNF